MTTHYVPTDTETTTGTEGPSTDEIYLLESGDGPHFHFLDNLATIKVAPMNGAAMSAVEFTAPKDFGPPLHVHRDEDEIVVVLDGELDVHVGDDARVAGSGALVWLPSGVPHTFQVRTESCRMLSVTARRTPGAPVPNFDAMVAALGIPTAEPQMPEPMDINPGQVAEVCGAHGIDILGPPPGPRGE